LLGSDPGHVVQTHVPSASDVTTAWRYRNLINLIQTNVQTDPATIATLGA